MYIAGVHEQNTQCSCVFYPTCCLSVPRNFLTAPYATTALGLPPRSRRTVLAILKTRNRLPVKSTGRNLSSNPPGCVQKLMAERVYRYPGTGQVCGRWGSRSATKKAPTVGHTLRSIRWEFALRSAAPIGTRSSVLVRSGVVAVAVALTASPPPSSPPA